MNEYPTKNPLNLRVIAVLEEKRLPQERAAAMLGVSRPLISKVYNTQEEASEKVLIGLLKAFPEYNPSWIFNGEGDKFRPSSQGSNNISQSGQNVFQRASEGSMIGDSTQAILELGKCQERLRIAISRLEEAGGKVSDLRV